MKKKAVVEMCCGIGSECMAANLILSHGYKGYLFDGNENDSQIAKSFFNQKKDCSCVQPRITLAWITKNNVNELLRDSGVTGEVDLLSYNDYYIWEAISEINPRLCVFETHDIIPGNLERIRFNPARIQLRRSSWHIRWA